MANLLTSYDLEKFKWKPIEGVGAPRGRVRLLGGSERVHDVLDRHFKGLHTMFFGLMLDLHDPVNITKFSSSALECWTTLRFQFPTIASFINSSDQELPTLTYTTGTPQEIGQWAQRTFLVHSPSAIDLEQLRADESQKKVPSSDGDYTRMHLVPGELASDGTVSKFGLLLHNHHSQFDGSAAKVIMNFYLDQLTKALSDSDTYIRSESIQWGDELENLPPAVFNILNSDEVLPIPPDSTLEPSFDHDYYECMRSVLAGLGAATKDAYGFRVRPNDPEWPKTRRAEAFFTRKESGRILTASKMSGFTFTHIAHAALAMVVIADNPPPSASSSEYLNNQHIANRRGRLNPNYSLYPGCCISISSIRIPLSVFLSPDGSVFPLDKAMLLKVAEVTKRQYRVHSELPSALSHMAQLGEIWTSTIVQSGNVTLPPDQCYSFVSDGKGEHYLNPIFTADTGETVLSLAKFFISLNAFDPGPLFRLSSWDGITSVAADYNTNIVRAEDTMNYLNQWKTFMLLVLD